MVDRTNLALGRQKRPETRGATLKASAFFKAVPEHPIAVDNTTDVEYGMDGNDQFGVCVPTAKDNARRTTSRLLLGQQISMSQSEVFDDYRLQNPDFDPTTGVGDRGMVIQDYLTALAKRGDIVAFAELDVTDDEELTAAQYLFLGTIWGVDLEIAQQSQAVWDYRRSGEWGGHCVWVPAYERGGMQDCITWRERVPTTDAFRRHQLDEAYVVLFSEHIAHPDFREGFDLEKFAQAYTDLTGRPFPAVVPPQPNPTPDTGAASFPGAYPEVDQHVLRSAARQGVSVTSWLNHHFRMYFDLKGE